MLTRSRIRVIFKLQLCIAKLLVLYPQHCQTNSPNWRVNNNGCSVKLVIFPCKIITQKVRNNRKSWSHKLIHICVNCCAVLSRVFASCHQSYTQRESSSWRDMRSSAAFKATDTETISLEPALKRTIFCSILSWKLDTLEEHVRLSLICY